MLKCKANRKELVVKIGEGRLLMIRRKTDLSLFLTAECKRSRRAGKEGQEERGRQQNEAPLVDKRKEVVKRAGIDKRVAQEKNVTKEGS